MGNQHKPRYVEGFRYPDGPGAEFGVQQQQMSQQEYNEQQYAQQYAQQQQQQQQMQRQY
jgi:hypothetical protein